MIKFNGPAINSGGLSNEVSGKILKALFRGEIRKLFRAAKLKSVEQMIRLLLGRKEVDAFRAGVFRNGGEIHHNMYDKYSLGRLLTAHGFEEVRVCGAGESNIASFCDFELDVFEGKPRKPDSLYLEAVSP